MNEHSPWCLQFVHSGLEVCSDELRGQKTPIWTRGWACIYGMCMVNELPQVVQADCINRPSYILIDVANFISFVFVHFLWKFTSVRLKGPT